MKMAKASEADLDMAFALTNALGVLGLRWGPCMPDAIAQLGRGDDLEHFHRDDDAQCGRALRHLLDLDASANLMRVVWGMSVLLDPRNACVDPAADTLEHHPDAKAGQAARNARPLAEWHEDMGAVLWWRFPVDERPWIGRPIDDEWPCYHTHWTPLVVPAAP